MKVLREVLNIVLWMYLKEDEIYSTCFLLEFEYMKKIKGLIVLFFIF